MTQPARPRSPWSGSRHETEHRWQLDGARDLPGAIDDLRSLAGQLRAAHTAGWSLAEPMRDGYLLATRPSRRRRGQPAGGSALLEKSGAAPRLRWRARLVDEPPVAGDEVLRLDEAGETPVLVWDQGSMRQVGGPTIAPRVLTELTRQVSEAEVAHRRWGVAPARVGPSMDLVAEGSALRIHAVADGALVRTLEALSFRHAADGAVTLLDAAAAYERLARAAAVMIAAGGRLTGVDDGLLHVSYGRR